MKLLENAHLDCLSELIHTLSLTTGSCRLQLKLESYSCKMTGDDKKLLRHITNASEDTGLQALSPPNLGYGYHSPTVTGTGQEQDACSTRTFHCLVSTLNASFRPDYDFSNTKSEEFCRMPNLNTVTQDIHNIFYTSLGDSFCDIKEHLWNTIDKEIGLQECSFYSYNSDLDSDPYGDCLWYFNFFFYNKKMKRILFFSCQAHPYGDTTMSDDDDMYYSGTDMGSSDIE